MFSALPDRDWEILLSAEAELCDSLVCRLLLLAGALEEDGLLSFGEEQAVNESNEIIRIRCFLMGKF